MLIFNKAWNLFVLIPNTSGSLVSRILFQNWYARVKYLPNAGLSANSHTENKQLYFITELQEAKISLNTTSSCYKSNLAF